MTLFFSLLSFLLRCQIIKLLIFAFKYIVNNTHIIHTYIHTYIHAYMWGQKVLEDLTHSISSPRPTPRRKKCPGTNEGNPNCQNALPRKTLSSAGQNHGRKKCHVVQGHPLEDHKRDSKPYGLAIGE